MSRNAGICSMGDEVGEEVTSPMKKERKIPRPGFTGSLKEVCTISYTSTDDEVDINTVKVESQKFWVF